MRARALESTPSLTGRDQGCFTGFSWPGEGLEQSSHGSGPGAGAAVLLGLRVTGRGRGVGWAGRAASLHTPPPS